MKNIFKITAFTIILLFSSNIFAQPTPITTDSRIRTLVFNANEVYQLTFHYGYQSFIEFSADENIEMISIGESFAWLLTPAGKRLFVRPLEIAAHTNMTIITNKRTYQFDIRSAEYTGKADEELVYTVRFYYPTIEAPLAIPSQLSKPNLPKNLIPQRPITKSPSSLARVDKKLPEDLSIDSLETKLNFNYTMTGNGDNIKPLKIYDDGKKTYFQFQNNNLIVPSISTVDIFGNELRLNTSLKDNYVVIDTLSSQFTLRLADSLMCVFNEGVR